MPNRAVVCVATTPQYQVGMARLAGEVERQELAEMIDLPSERRPRAMMGWPPHELKPYAFKAYALEEAADRGYSTLVWADACMLPVQSMEPLFERIERDGYWFSRNGWTNYEWTADSAYPDLFPESMAEYGIDRVREVNRNIPHVVATCFGLSMASPQARAFLKEYVRLARDTDAFKGPWVNCGAGCNKHAMHYTNPRYGICGPADVRGHRHDQTAASVLAWRAGFQLTDPPEIFAYGKQGEPFDPKTIMIADGGY